MERGWDATGLLKAVYEKVGGVDKLAELTGISRSTLSSYNSGRRPLGFKNAKRIAEAAKVPVSELGLPEAPQGFATAPLGRLVSALERRSAGAAPMEPQERELLEQLAAELATLSRRLRRVAARRAD
jgi:transcriptional regulator with XRE-family HTH domain